ncbi:uncharacterized protein LOC135399823 [Ornithodoros turicata]|uniref:uncharacterized protein LOC135393550 n=1 Tax=Ornithodoros turicata TaxID=34597 RepID=UPI003139CA29
MSTSDILFYTGLSEEVFQKILLCLEQSFRPLSQLPLEDQLLLALMRLRLGTLYRDLAWRFSISPSSVCKIFNSVLKSLNEIMKYSVVWLPKSRIQSSMPDSFIQSGYENTRCILDCTEVFLQRPKKQMARAQTYSSYKAHNTLKFLIVIAPNGFIMYVSKAYGGRASDKFIVKDCGILEYFARNDEIMADRGFTLDPYLAAQGVKLNVPAFTRGKAQLSEEEVTKTRRIASVRIHVERAINRMKTYRIFKSSLSIKCKKTIDMMIFVCAGLCNFKPPLIAEVTGTQEQQWGQTAHEP